MEPEEQIIQQYFNHILKSFTISNIKCRKSKEIDILAYCPLTGKAWHVESRVSTRFPMRMTATYRKNGTSYRNGLDWMKENKFDHPAVLEKISEYFGEKEYERIIVIHRSEMGWDPSWNLAAFMNYGIRVWYIMEIINELQDQIRVVGSRNDVMRLLELITLSERNREAWINNTKKRIIKEIRARGRKVNGNAEELNPGTNQVNPLSIKIL